MVEIEGIPKPQIGCNTLVRDGLKVKTNTPAVLKLRKAVLEFFFLHHPVDCSICDQSGECYLQDYYLAHGNYVSRMDLPKDHKRKHIDAGKHIMLDAERCVLCTRCTRFCDDVTGTGELRIVNRGHRSEITLFPGKKVDNPYSLNTVEICPVGALTSKDFRFQWRVWYQNSTASICAGCSRGCNIYMDHADGRAYRYRARHNPDVNGHWLCDDGRMTYKRLNDDRVFAVRGPVEDADDDLLLIDDAVSEIAEVLKGSGTVAALVSPELCNEDLFAAKLFAEEVAGAKTVRAGSLRPKGVEDEILRKADLHPNIKGCEVMGIWGDLEEGLGHGGDLLLVFGDDLLEPDEKLRRKVRDSFKTIVTFARNDNPGVSVSEWVVPIAPHSEMEGSFTNFEGRVQLFHLAIPPKGDVLPLWQSLTRLARAMGKDWGWDSIKALRRDLCESVSQWKDGLLEGEGAPVEAGAKEGGGD
jgi:NADH-quinone oxidoreductase subunit G